VSRLLLVALALTLLTGCLGPARPEVKPVQSQCADLCYVPCVEADGDTGVRWEGDAEDPAAWDGLADDTTAVLSGKLRQCEVARRACTRCLDRLEAQGVIVQ
jgi:hypothetical protein